MKLNKKDEDILTKEFSIEQIKELYYHGALNRVQCQKLMIKMIKKGKEYKGLVSSTNGDLFAVTNNSNGLKAEKLEGFKIVRK